MKESQSVILFEAYNNGKRVAYTRHKDCVPSEAQLESMAAGLKLKLNGKAWKATCKKKTT